MRVVQRFQPDCHARGKGLIARSSPSPFHERTTIYDNVTTFVRRLRGPASIWSRCIERLSPRPNFQFITLVWYNSYINVRSRFDRRKSARLRANPKRGIGFEEAQEIFARPFYLDQRSDIPEQYRAIGWVKHRL